MDKYLTIIENLKEEIENLKKEREELESNYEASQNQEIYKACDIDVLKSEIGELEIQGKKILNAPKVFRQQLPLTLLLSFCIIGMLIYCLFIVVPHIGVLYSLVTSYFIIGAATSTVPVAVLAALEIKKNYRKMKSTKKTSIDELNEKIKEKEETIDFLEVFMKIDATNTSVYKNLLDKKTTEIDAKQKMLSTLEEERNTEIEAIMGDLLEQNIITHSAPSLSSPMTYKIVKK